MLNSFSRAVGVLAALVGVHEQADQGGQYTNEAFTQLLDRT
ncbi:hypothetical protein [Hymenobacter arcticus]